jgi:hypothetical protein
MASKTVEEAHVPETEPGEPGRPAWVGPLFTTLVVLIGIVVLAQVLGHQGDIKDVKAIGQFSATAALLGSLVIGMSDAFGRAYIPSLLSQAMPPQLSDPLAASLISASAYILMALVLLLRPLGLVGRR